MLCHYWFSSCLSEPFGKLSLITVNVLVKLAAPRAVPFLSSASDIVI